MSLLLFASLFFVTNPLLSMQMDWDLFSCPGPVLLVFVVVLAGQLPGRVWVRKVFPPCVGLALLCMPVFIVHASVPMLSARLESVGVRMFKTYYEWSARTLTYALSLSASDSKEFVERRDRVLTNLEPYALPNRDYEYARLLSAAGEHELRVAKDYRAAAVFFERASIIQRTRPMS